MLSAEHRGMTTLNVRTLHSTGLVSESLAAQVFDFMREQHLGLLGLAAAADVISADCRMNEWVLTVVKKAGLGEEQWLTLLDDGEQIHQRAVRAMKVFADNHNLDELCTAFAEVTEKLNSRVLPS